MEKKTFYQQVDECDLSQEEKTAICWAALGKAAAIVFKGEPVQLEENSSLALGVDGRVRGLNNWAGGVDPSLVDLVPQMELTDFIETT